MHWQINPHSLALLLSALVSVIVSVYTWRRRPSPGAAPLSIFMLAATLWSLTYALELGSTDLTAKVFWAKAQYLGIVTVAPAMLALVLQHIGRHNWLIRGNLALLATIPVTTLVLVWTNEAHGLIWSGVELVTTGPYPTLNLTHGLFFTVLLVYSYLCLLFGSALLLREVLRGQRLYRAQAGILLLGTLIPWVANLLYIADLTKIPNLDLTPFAFTLTGLVAAWGLFQFQLLNIVPIARSSVIENMSDGVFVIDAEGRIVDANPAALRLIRHPGADLIGQPIEQIELEPSDWVKHLDAEGEAHTEITLSQDGEQYCYHLRVSSLDNRQGETSGRVIVLRDTTNLKQAEAALRETQRQLETQNVEFHKLSQAVEQSANMVVITDIQGNIEYVNPKFAEVTGYPVKEALDQNISILKSGEQSDEQYRDLWQTISSGRDWYGEFRNRRKDGSLYWEQSTITPIYDDTGHMTHFVAIKEDITERKQTERVLTNLLELSRVLTTTRDMDQALVQAVQSAVEIIPVADRGTLQWLDNDGETLRTVATSDSGVEEKNISFKQGEGIAGHVLESKRIINVSDVLQDERFVPGDPAIHFRSLLVAPLVVKERSLGTLSLSSERVDAFTSTDETLAELVADQMAAALENAQEFTARRQAEDALYRQTERLKIQHEIAQSILAARLPETTAVAAIGRIRQLIPCQRAMIMSVDEDGKLNLLASESSADIGPKADQGAYQALLEERTLTSGWALGAMDLETLSKRTPFQQALFEAGVRSFVVVPLIVENQLVGTLNVESGETRAFTANHVTIASEVAASLAVATRQARLYERAQQEITERIQAQEALRQYTAELEARNAELDAFAHTVAHDLKNPVSTIVGYSDMLVQKRTAMSADMIHEFLDSLARSAMKMSIIIDELLLLSSVRGMGEIQTYPLDMERIVDEVQSRLRYLLDEYEAELALPAGWPAALGYTPWIEEVWVNYISNALKYGGRPPRIELGAERLPSPRYGEKKPQTQTLEGQVRFWVRDNGKGLSPEEQGRLFTPFERLHQVRVEGHGLGLSIVQRIVRKLGGRVGVESDGSLRQGSTFYFTLPGAPPELPMPKSSRPK